MGMAVGAKVTTSRRKQIGERGDFVFMKLVMDASKLPLSLKRRSEITCVVKERTLPEKLHGRKPKKFAP